MQKQVLYIYNTQNARELQSDDHIFIFPVSTLLARVYKNMNMPMRKEVKRREGRRIEEKRNEEKRREEKNREEKRKEDPKSELWRQNTWFITASADAGCINQGYCNGQMLIEMETHSCSFASYSEKEWESSMLYKYPPKSQRICN